MLGILGIEPFLSISLRVPAESSKKPSMSPNALEIELIWVIIDFIQSI